MTKSSADHNHNILNEWMSIWSKLNQLEVEKRPSKSKDKKIILNFVSVQNKYLYALLTHKKKNPLNWNKWIRCEKNIKKIKHHYLTITFTTLEYVNSMKSENQQLRWKHIEIIVRK